MGSSRKQTERGKTGGLYQLTGRVASELWELHLAVPVLGFGVDRPENLHVPLAAAPRLDHLGRDDVDQDLREQAAFRIAFKMVGRLVPAEIRVEHQRQKEVVPVVDDDELSAGTLLRRVIDQVLLGAVRADVALQRELARDDLFDRDFLVPAVAAIL